MQNNWRKWKHLQQGWKESGHTSRAHMEEMETGENVNGWQSADDSDDDVDDNDITAHNISL
jgi:hypothetical protein